MRKNTDFIIRPENEQEYPVIYELIQTAFSTARVKDGTEQDFAVRLRDSGGYIPALALVAERRGRLIGHAMLTETRVEGPGGRFGALMLAPLSVVLEYRGRGIGSALVREGLRVARELGYKAVFLCGDPAYYMRFGFRPSCLYGIGHESIPEQYLMVAELVPDALEGVTGMVRMG